ncbi:DNA-directed RNA polymerase III subunit RPC5 [Saguinus oedipus]|uniref:DNA-directed RNA polymerase III subunit RPC5 n=1 Tax=Saguinus oedipus TaxID=9490 RepID=A0ABQ9ULG6_SAGOE|nr:DNA-directed RNA polymerase III subunit RPC5 [Saguinus oedipus]
MYPVRPASMTYDDIPHLSAKIKPKQQKVGLPPEGSGGQEEGMMRVELEMAIDTLNPNYCRSKGEQIALNVDGACADETSTYSSKLMDKQTFCSSQTTSNTSRYAAALYRQGTRGWASLGASPPATVALVDFPVERGQVELGLPPAWWSQGSRIGGWSGNGKRFDGRPRPSEGLLRPSFSYLDKADAKHREREAANEAGDSSQDEAEDDVKQITDSASSRAWDFVIPLKPVGWAGTTKYKPLPNVRFSRPESEQARQRRVQSYEFLQKKHAEEAWVHLHYYGLKDSRSEHERQYLLCPGSSGVENTELVKSPSEYLLMLMPPSQEEEKDKPVAPSNVLSMAQLRTLPLADQIKILMKNVKVMPFANLMSLLGPSIDSVAVLRGIQKVAMLVQGNWVVKSYAVSWGLEGRNSGTVGILFIPVPLSPALLLPTLPRLGPLVTVAKLLCRGRDSHSDTAPEDGAVTVELPECRGHGPGLLLQHTLKRYLHCGGSDEPHVAPEGSSQGSDQYSAHVGKRRGLRLSLEGQRDILYPKDSSSPHSGVPAEVLCRGRDFVMWKFTQSRWVVRKEVATVTKLCAEDVKDFLEHMAVVRINKGWEFILPYDGEFIKKHPDVVQRQHMLWTGIQAK